MSLSPSRLQIYLIAGILFITGWGFALYKALVMDFPLLPGESRDVWTIESKVSFKPSGGPVDVSLALPQHYAGWTVLDEHFASSGFSFSVDDQSTRRRARWVRQSLEKSATLYYKLQAYQSEAADLGYYPVKNLEAPYLEPDQQAAMERVLKNLQKEPANTEQLTSRLLQELLQESPDQDLAFLLGANMDDDQQLSKSKNRLNVALDILATAGILAHPVRGVFLEDGRRRQSLVELLEVYTGKRWLVFNPDTGEPGLPENFFVWQRGGESILDVVGGHRSKIEFALVKNTLPAKTVLLMEREFEEQPLIDFSIYSLPVEQQGMFKGILLLPVGALVVVLLRVLIGIRTSGTFMPILIALAFMQTTLLIGLLIFLAVVGAGLWIRNYLSHLNLLLVARVTAVVIVVILLMAVLSVVSYKMGLDQALTVTFFPTIILAWTIERMSILWEEEGGKEVLIQGGGSLLAAVLAFTAMTSRLIEHLTFNFPELLVALLGVVLALGKYNGYRLSELYRFRYLEEQDTLDNRAFNEGRSGDRAVEDNPR